MCICKHRIARDKHFLSIMWDTINYVSHSSSPNGTDKVFATVVHGPMWENL